MVSKQHLQHHMQFADCFTCRRRCRAGCIVACWQLQHLSVGHLSCPQMYQPVLSHVPVCCCRVQCSSLHEDSGIILLGDAAHAVTPVGGQGCNSALEDCEVLEQVLAQGSKSFLCLPQAYCSTVCHFLWLTQRCRHAVMWGVVAHCSLSGSKSKLILGDFALALHC